MRVGIYTLGCKVNQYETQAMEQELLRRGHELVDFAGVADAYGFRRDSATSSIRNGYKVHGLIVKKITKEEYETYNKKRNQEND